MTCLVTLHTVSDALQLEALLQGAGTPARVIPVPRRLSSSCGYAVQAQAASDAAAKEMLLQSGVAWDTLYEVCDAEKGEAYVVLCANPENA